MADGLTAKQRAFVAAYLSNGFNGSLAARTVSPHAKRPDQIAYEYLRKPEIAAAVRQGLAEQAMPADEVLARIAEQARGTMEDFLDEAGDIDLKQARERNRLHLIKTRATTKEGERIELYSAQSALELLAKHHALLTEKVELSGEAAVKVYAGFDPDNV